MEHYLTGYAQFLQNISMSNHTVKQYVLDAKHFIAFWAEQRDVSFVDVQKKYRSHLQEKYANASVNRKLAGTRKFIHFLYDRAYVESFDDSLFEPIEPPEQTLQFLTAQQIDQVNNTLQTMFKTAMDDEQLFLATRHIAMFELFLTTGVKPFEAIRMEWSHIQFEQLTVLHHHTYRIVELPTTLHEKLEQLQIMNRKLFGDTKYVWLGLGNKRGEPITEKTVERFFAMLSKKVGFKVTATFCRYTFMKKEDDAQLFKQLGYTRKDVMLERLNKLNN